MAEPGDAAHLPVWGTVGWHDSLCVAEPAARAQGVGASYLQRSCAGESIFTDSAFGSDSLLADPSATVERDNW